MFLGLGYVLLTFPSSKPMGEQISWVNGLEPGLVTTVSPLCSQEGLLWRVHNILDPLYCAAHTAVDRARR